jgi:hypothetical protein
VSGICSQPGRITGSNIRITLVVKYLRRVDAGREVRERLAFDGGDITWRSGGIEYWIAYQSHGADQALKREGVRPGRV